MLVSENSKSCRGDSARSLFIRFCKAEAGDPSHIHFLHRLLEHLLPGKLEVYVGRCLRPWEEQSQPSPRGGQLAVEQIIDTRGITPVDHEKGSQHQASPHGPSTVGSESCLLGGTFPFHTTQSLATCHFPQRPLLPVHEWEEKES